MTTLTATSTTASSTLAEVLQPLVAVLSEDPSGETSITMEEHSGIPGLPDVDPTMAAVYYLTSENKAPALRRLERLIQITAIPNGLSKKIPDDRIPSPLFVPIRFTLIRQMAGLFGSLVSEHYLLAEIETETGDLPGAERQVALLAEHLSQSK